MIPSSGTGFRPTTTTKPQDDATATKPLTLTYKDIQWQESIEVPGLPDLSALDEVHQRQALTRHFQTVIGVFLASMVGKNSYTLHGSKALAFNLIQLISPQQVRAQEQSLGVPPKFYLPLFEYETHDIDLISERSDIDIEAMAKLLKDSLAGQAHLCDIVVSAEVELGFVMDNPHSDKAEKKRIYVSTARNCKIHAKQNGNILLALDITYPLTHEPERSFSYKIPYAKTYRPTAVMLGQYEQMVNICTLEQLFADLLHALHLTGDSHSKQSENKFNHRIKLIISLEFANALSSEHLSFWDTLTKTERSSTQVPVELKSYGMQTDPPHIKDSSTNTVNESKTTEVKKQLQHCDKTIQHKPTTTNQRIQTTLSTEVTCSQTDITGTLPGQTEFAVAKNTTDQSTQISSQHETYSNQKEIRDLADKIQASAEATLECSIMESTPQKTYTNALAFYDMHALCSHYDRLKALCTLRETYDIIGYELYIKIFVTVPSELYEHLTKTSEECNQTIKDIKKMDIRNYYTIRATASLKQIQLAEIIWHAKAVLTEIKTEFKLASIEQKQHEADYLKAIDSELAWLTAINSELERDLSRYKNQLSPLANYLVAQHKSLVEIYRNNPLMLKKNKMFLLVLRRALIRITEESVYHESYMAHVWLCIMGKNYREVHQTEDTLPTYKELALVLKSITNPLDFVVDINTLYPEAYKQGLLQVSAILLISNMRFIKDNRDYHIACRRNNLLTQETNTLINEICSTFSHHVDQKIQKRSTRNELLEAFNMIPLLLELLELATACKDMILEEVLLFKISDEEINKKTLSQAQQLQQLLS